MKDINAASVNLRGTEAVQTLLKAGADSDLEETKAKAEAEAVAGHPQGRRLRSREPAGSDDVGKGGVPGRPPRAFAADGRALCCTIWTSCGSSACRGHVGPWRWPAE
eukprot:6149954-Amphidinium_carterae.2